MSSRRNGRTFVLYSKRKKGKREETNQKEMNHGTDIGEGKGKHTPQVTKHLVVGTSFILYSTPYSTSTVHGHSKDWGRSVANESFILKLGQPRAPVETGGSPLSRGLWKLDDQPTTTQKYLFTTPEEKSSPVARRRGGAQLNLGLCKRLVQVACFALLVELWRSTRGLRPGL